MTDRESEPGDETVLQSVPPEPDEHTRRTDPAPGIVEDPTAPDLEPAEEPSDPQTDEEDLKTAIKHLVESLKPQIVSELKAEMATMMAAHELHESDKLEAKLEAHHNRLAATNKANFREEVFEGFNPFLEHFEEWQKTQALRIDSLEKHSQDQESRLKLVESLRVMVERMQAELDEVKKRLAGLEKA